MIEQILKAKFVSIFDFRKTSFNAPGPDQEQECLFIELDKVNSKFSEGRYIAEITGKATVYAQSAKLPMGYMAEKIQHATNDLTKDLFFFDLEENKLLHENIVMRSFSFIYLFNGQHDPNLGSIESITISGG